MGGQHAHGELEQGTGIQTLNLALVEGGMQLIRRLAEYARRYLFAMFIEEKYLDVPLSQRETFHTGGFVAGSNVSQYAHWTGTAREKSM